MKKAAYVVAAISALSLAACVTHEREVVREEPATVVHERTVVHDQAPPAPVVREERQVVINTNDVHRTWWNTYHPGEAYEPGRAMAAHRFFCEDHPADSTCAGWDWR